MTYKTTITDNYILITSDEEIKIDDWVIDNRKDMNGYIHQFSIPYKDDLVKKITAHLPLNNAPKLEGVPLLPPLPSGEDDVEKLAKEYIDDEWQKDDDAVKFGIKVGYGVGYDKAKDKYRFTEEDMKKAVEMAQKESWDEGGFLGLEYEPNEIIQSLSQPKMPTHFKVETESGLWGQGHYVTYPKIINGVMQGEWIY